MRNHYEVDPTAGCVRIWCYHKTDLHIALVDESDLPRLLNFRCTWYASPARAPLGKYYVFAKRWNPETHRNHTVSLHRFIMEPAEDLTVHHIDNDGLDNRRVNLDTMSLKLNHRQRQPEKDWEEHDLKESATAGWRETNRKLREIRERFGYSRQHVWKAWRDPGYALGLQRIFEAEGLRRYDGDKQGHLNRVNGLKREMWAAVQTP